MRVSVCLITRDEERFLAGCLESVRAAADEVVLVDAGSTDATVDVARGFGCTVIHRAWDDDFAAARNAGIAAATGDWILCIDADERLIGAEALRDLVAGAAPETGAFLVEREDFVRHPDTGRTERYPIGMVRLFRRHPAIRYVGAVHERPNETVRAAGFRIESTARVRFTHLVADRPDDELRRKQTRYLALLDRELACAPGDAWMRYYRAKTRWYLGFHDEADADLRAVAGDTDAPPEQRAAAHAMRAALALHLGRPDEALAMVDASLDAFPLQSIAHYLRGEARYALGDWAGAADAYARVRLAQDPAVVTDWVPGDLYLPPATRAWKLGSCALAAGDAATALAHFRVGMRAEPDDAACWFGAAHVALAAGDGALARTLL
ncbi:MAG TPA: glycosyltransferase, partial [Longimicrobium sp.]|nr:glycosyltransferase [Longimicrobium sp.]